MLKKPEWVNRLLLKNILEVCCLLLCCAMLRCAVLLLLFLSSLQVMSSQHIYLSFATCLCRVYRFWPAFCCTIFLSTIVFKFVFKFCFSFSLRSRTNQLRNSSSSFSVYRSTVIGVCSCKHCEHIYDQHSCQPHYWFTYWLSHFQNLPIPSENTSSKLVAVQKKKSQRKSWIGHHCLAPD